MIGAGTWLGQPVKLTAQHRSNRAILRRFNVGMGVPFSLEAFVIGDALRNGIGSDLFLLGADHVGMGRCGGVGVRDLGHGVQAHFERPFPLEVGRQPAPPHDRQEQSASERDTLPGYRPTEETEQGHQERPVLRSWYRA